MPPQRKNPGEKMDCSRRSVSLFQTYVNHLITKKPEKIKSLLARALMNDDFLMDFNGQVHANECVFTYPDSNWYSVYLVNQKGEQYWSTDGATKFYFKLDFDVDQNGIPHDARIIEATTTVPPELENVKNCVIKPNGKCGNPESKKKKKKVVDDSDDESDENTPEEILAQVQQIQTGSASQKQKMPREFFEGLGSKSLIIDWMIANMKPADILKCIQKNSSSQSDISHAQSIIESQPSSSYSVNDVLQSYPPNQVSSMLKVVTKEELVKAVSGLTGDRKKQGIVTLCRRAGVKGYTLKTNSKTGKVSIVDEEGDPVDSIDQVLDICAEREVYRLKKLLKISSIASDVKQGNFTKQQLMEWKGGNKRLPYSTAGAVKKYFPLIKDLENQNGDLYGRIPSVREDGVLYYYKLDDILGKDLKKLDDKISNGSVSFGRKRTKTKKYSKKRSKKVTKKRSKKVTKVKKVQFGRKTTKTKKLIKKVKRKPVKRKPVKRKPVKRKPIKRKPVKRRLVKRKPVKRTLVKRKPVKRRLVKRRVVRRKPVKRRVVRRRVLRF